MRRITCLLLILVSYSAFAAKPPDLVTLVAEAHADVTSGHEPLVVNFSARGSFDPENGALNYSWDFGDGNTGVGLDIQNTYNEGFYVAVLTVTDTQGLFDVTSIEIRAGVVDLAPSVDALNANPSSGTAPLFVQFSSSVTAGNGALTYSWEFGNGEFSFVPNPSTTYVSPGAYCANLIVTDEDGDSATTCVVVDVAP